MLPQWRHQPGTTAAPAAAALAVIKVVRPKRKETFKRKCAACLKKLDAKQLVQLLEELVAISMKSGCIKWIHMVPL
jgi:hypothetical protein